MERERERDGEKGREGGRNKINREREKQKTTGGHRGDTKP